MSDTTIFLTGATGNAGYYVLAELVRRSIDVTALVRKPADLLGCRTVIGELTTIDRWAGEIRNASAIIHLACPRTQEAEPVLRLDEAVALVRVEQVLVRDAVDAERRHDLLRLRLLDPRVVRSLADQQRDADLISA